MKEQFPTVRSGFHPPNALRFGGGGRTATPTTPPITQAPVTAATPPASASSAEVAQAQSDLRRQSLKKRGFSKTVLAGDSGGWFPGNTTASPTNPKAITPGGAGPGAKTLGS